MDYRRGDVGMGGVWRVLLAEVRRLDSELEALRGEIGGRNPTKAGIGGQASTPEWFGGEVRWRNGPEASV